MSCACLSVITKVKDGRRSVRGACQSGRLMSTKYHHLSRWPKADSHAGDMDTALGIFVRCKKLCLTWDGDMATSS